MAKNEGNTGGVPVQTQVQQGAAREPGSAGAKVTVACNLPHGLRIRLFQMIPSQELVMGGGVREVRIAEHVGEDILIYGTATEVGKLARAPIVGGYALTHGVDSDAWYHWLKDNQNSPMVRNRCIFAYEDARKAEDAAKDHAGTRTGLEAFMRDGDPRRPRPGANLSEVTEEDGRAGRVDRVA